ncbi:MAG: glucose-6-phosphate dehydrogenase [Actinomycetota bacterium]|nr:glucose-6-phosphate dehydrogenase [Actinomycetota bacterium]
MIRRLVLFGASGDLAGRYLLPALAALQARDQLPQRFRVTGAAIEPWDDAAFQEHAAAKLERHAADVPGQARRQLLDSLAYRQVDSTDAAEVAAVGLGESEREPEAVATYLALPPGMFPDAVKALGRAGLPPGSRIAVEKPFGEDLESARELNRLLERAVGPAGERAIFRVDHVLGMATTRRLLELRLTHPGLDRLWNARSVEAIHLLWEETLALEGRAGYFDRAGTLKDVVQNHLMQLLGLVAMERPPGGGERELRDRKVAALRSIRSLRRGELRTRTRRGRYEAGAIDGRQIPAYAGEEGVDPGRETETFAELELELESERWRGTDFVLRAGKALARRRKGVLARFRAGAELWIGIDGPDDIRLELRYPSSEAGLQSLALSAPPPQSELPAYGRVLLELLDGGSTLAVRGDEAEEAWKVVMPVLEGWSAGEVPLLSYPAGSDGP